MDAFANQFHRLVTYWPTDIVSRPHLFTYPPVAQLDDSHINIFADSPVDLSPLTPMGIPTHQPLILVTDSPTRLLTCYPMNLVTYCPVLTIHILLIYEPIQPICRLSHWLDIIATICSWPIDLLAYQRVILSTYQPAITSTYHPITTSTYQPIRPATSSPIHPSTYQPITRFTVLPIHLFTWSSMHAFPRLRFCLSNLLVYAYIFNRSTYFHIPLFAD